MARKYGEYTVGHTLTIYEADKVVFRNKLNTISPEEVTMNSYSTDFTGMPGMVLVMALEYLHVLWMKAFEKPETGIARPEGRKAAGQQNAVSQVECCSTSYAG
jgi:hypothetical protein